MKSICVLADDLSGACELAALAAGFRLTVDVRIQDCSGARPLPQVLLINTETRNLAVEEAVSRTRALLRSALESGCSWFYKKTDSVLRGHPRAEISACLEELGLTKALLVPANPSRGRTVADGQYLINGSPLSETVFASDPDFPAKSSSIKVLLQRDPGAAINVGAGIAEAHINVPDAVTPDHVLHLAELGTRDLFCAGAADFFRALLPRVIEAAPVSPRFLPPPPNILFVCGSAAAWSSRRLEALGGGVPVFELPFDAEALMSVLKSGGTALVGIVDAISEPERLLGVFVDELARVLHNSRPQMICIEGGSTAFSLLKRMDWTRLHIAGLLAVDLAVFSLSVPDSPLIAIKPGSYPWPQTIWAALRESGA